MSRAERIEGAIVLPPGCRPSRACSEDMTRIGLRHGWLKRRGEDMWLLATDSYIAVALRVTGEGLQEGIIPFEALEAIEAGETGDHNIARVAEALRIWSGGGLKPVRVTGPMSGCRGLVMPARIT